MNKRSKKDGRRNNKKPTYLPKKAVRIHPTISLDHERRLEKLMTKTVKGKRKYKGKSDIIMQGIDL